jgi:hypothetical protein
LAGVLLALVGTHVALMLDWHGEQDGCSFGPVSNARYRELLAEAKRKQATEWPGLVWHDRKAGDQLKQRFDDLSRGATSIYERIAAMHAVMRAVGADYRMTAFDSDDPYEAAFRAGGHVSFDYNIDANRLGFFAPVWRLAWLIGSLDVGRQDTSRPPPHPQSVIGDIGFIVHFPKWLENRLRIPQSRFGESCPRLPSARVAERLDQLPLKEK